MKTLIKLEELGMFLLAFFGFIVLGGQWYFFLLFILAPDFGMIGYLLNPLVGAITYNLTHHKMIGILLFVSGVFLRLYASTDFVMFAGLIILAHSSIDRVLGFGLKYPDSFKHTHLGIIGGKK